MNTEHLYYILEVSKCGSVNKAAHNCYISQSNLSNIIRNTEQEIGYSLFLRTSTGVAPTPAGKAFMLCAEKIVAERNNIQQIPQQLAMEEQLSVICARSSFVLRCYFDFRKQFPCRSVQDTFFEAGLRENLHAVVAQKCHIGIMVMFERIFPKYFEQAQRYNLNLQVLKNNIRPVVLMGNHHPLSAKKNITCADISAYPFVADAQLDKDDTLDILGMDEKSDLLYICDRGSVFDAVRRGGFLSIGINIAPGDAEVLGFTCRPIEDAEPMELCLLSSKKIPLNQRELHFISYLKQRLFEYYV